MLKEGRPGRIFSYGLLVNESFECNIKYSQQIQLKATRCPNWKMEEESFYFLIKNLISIEIVDVASLVHGVSCWEPATFAISIEIAKDPVPKTGLVCFIIYI